MTKRMLIDATHAEETRVVVLDGSRLEDFDVETSTKRQLKGNIYLAKVVRVEPSLQAAFVEYGGNRHGFLAFSEIHPDYYQIPVADRQRLLEMQAEEARREEEEDDLELALTQGGDAEPPPLPVVAAEAEGWAEPWVPPLTGGAAAAEPGSDAPPAEASGAEPWAVPHTPRLTARDQYAQALRSDAHEPIIYRDPAADDDEEGEGYDLNGDPIEPQPPPETIGGNESDSGEDHRERRIPPRFLRHYKIQEVIRRRQIMLVQVVKEERGTKGAALTTYLSLAGRFGVLMPNSPRGGGISRKITSAADRRRLREVIAELDIPGGMGLIIRTAGANRPKPEIRRDCEYLLRLWDDIRDHTLKSVAPALIYEEASLIKRAIRDVYSRDIDEILVDGEEGWRAAHDFMRMLMPAHAKKVQLWRDGGQPLFARQQVEAQLDAMLMPIVQLRSGGYLVINQAEALVAIDVNSGRSTRERNIEETALRTNLEAADEVARQLRLRDLAGLIVIDFIDMESKRHNAMVERRMKEALKNDRARIQVGHISHFGLLEMSRQRLRPSLAETSFIPCPHCGGTGHVRSTESSAIHVLRGIEDEGAKRRSAEIIVHVSTPIALYILNHKRERLREIELRYTMRVMIAADDSQIAPQFRIEKLRVRSADEIPPVVTPDRMMSAPMVYDSETEDEDDSDINASDEDEDESDEDAAEEARTAEGGEVTAEESERRRKRRRRRRRGGRREEQPNGLDVTPDAEKPEEAIAAEAPAAEDAMEAEQAAPDADGAETGEDAGEPSEGPMSEEEARSRRRGRRGGRRRRREHEGDVAPFSVPGADQPDLLPAYAGPTPADPFGQVFDIFDVMDRVEREAESQPSRRTPPFPAVATPAAEPAAPSAGLAAAEGLEAGPAAAGPDAPPVDTTVGSLPPAAEPLWRPDGPAHSQAPSIHSDTVSVEEAVAKASPPGPAPVDVSPAEPAPVDASPIEPQPAENQPAQARQAEAATPEPAQAEPTASEPAQPEPAPPEPAVKPIVIGAGGEPQVEKKRGWWRR